MTPRQWLLSALFLAFFGLKGAEAWFVLDNWPLSDGSMFQARRPPDELPRRASIYGAMRTDWHALSPGDFGLSEDELVRRLRDGEDLEETCGELARVLNRRRI